jgi:hypothetical protein
MEAWNFDSTGSQPIGSQRSGWKDNIEIDLGGGWL